MSTLKSQRILIIGGSSGIGYSVAEGALKSHADLVIIASSNASRVDSAVKRLESAKLGSGKVQGEVVDASNPDSLKDMLARIGEIDHLVFTSGERLPATFPDPKDIDAYRGFFDVRFWGATVAAQHAKIRPGGSITLTNGGAMIKPMNGWSMAAAISGAVDSMTRGLAVDLAPIRVNIVCCGFVVTETWNNMPPANLEAMLTERAEKLLVKHVAMPAEVAEAYLFLMKCTFITGQRIEVDGGSVLGA